jgi:hypothetical protein
MQNASRKGRTGADYPKTSAGICGTRLALLGADAMAGPRVLFLTRLARPLVLARLNRCDMTTLAPTAVLNETMGKLESALLSPVISGELATWIRNVQESAATFALDFTCYLNTVLHVQYAEIARTDPELLTRVEQLIEADQKLLKDVAAFHEELHLLGQRAVQVDKHESKLAEQRERVEQRGIDLLLRIKKQQAAADAWLAEAHYRDRGVAD